MSASTSAGWVRVVYRTLLAYPCDADALFRAAGLDPGVLADPQARVPVTALRRLWALAVEATGDPAFGLRTVRHAHLTSFQALGVAVLASLSLRDAFERCARYLAVVSEAARLALIDGPDGLGLQLEPPPEGEPPVPEAVDAFFGIFLLFCRAQLGRGFAPSAVTLKRPAPPDPSPWLGRFRCPVHFAAEAEVLWLPETVVDRPLVGADPWLAAANERLAAQALAEQRRTDWAARVEALLIQRLPQGDPGEGAIAEALHLSPRSLQRKLSEQGTHYAAILRDTRERLARRYLAEGRHSILEIAFLLGFSDVSSFSRAFRRWTGQPPSAFRR